MPVLYGDAAASANLPRINRSDVVFMGPKSADVYQAYAGTLVSWGGYAWSDSPQAVEDFNKRVQTAHDLGLRYCAGLAFRTAFAGMIDFSPEFMDAVCRDLNGNPILVPWLWDHKHKDHPAYWFCTNAPLYREYLRQQTRRATVAHIEGLHIDDYNGTAGTEWRGGCFCRYCMAAFRDYLRKNVPAERLKELGIQSLDDFDYGQFLRAQGVSIEDYRRRVDSSLPLGPEFMTFQYRAAAEWVGEIRRYAESLVGHPLMLSVNSSASSPKALVIAPQVTYFAGEVNHRASSLAWPEEPILVFKLCEALDRPMACTASGQDWAFINETKRVGLVRMWIAQAYAFGHQLMVPHRQWAYTETKGTHWYQSDPSDYAYLYRFVRDNARLFDDYDDATQVALLYSNAAFRSGNTQAKEACLWLARANVPFRIILAGDDWLDVRLSPDDLTGIKAIVVSEPLLLDEAQTAVLKEAGQRLVTWPDEEKLFRLVPRQISIEGADNITVVPRLVPGDDTRPFVCHLVNRNYDAATDTMVAQEDFRITLSKSLFQGATIGAAKLHSPGHESVEIAFTQTPEVVTLTVPQLDLWAIVELIPTL